MTMGLASVCFNLLNGASIREESRRESRSRSVLSPILCDDILASAALHTLTVRCLRDSVRCVRRASTAVVVVFCQGGLSNPWLRTTDRVIALSHEGRRRTRRHYEAAAHPSAWFNLCEGCRTTRELSTLRIPYRIQPQQMLGRPNRKSYDPGPSDHTVLQGPGHTVQTST